VRGHQRARLVVAAVLDVRRRLVGEAGGVAPVRGEARERQHGAVPAAPHRAVEERPQGHPGVLDCRPRVRGRDRAALRAAFVAGGARHRESRPRA
jgi:hypothetical protein